MEDYSTVVANSLLDIEAIKLRPTDPFTWASGWHSPIYCDNRRALGDVRARGVIRDAFVSSVRALYPSAEVVAGVATGAIAWGALVADALGLPFCYVRSAPKDHGTHNLIEGSLRAGAKVVVVEDLISTGGSSLKAVAALRDALAEVQGMVAIFSYLFPVAQEAFAKAQVRLHTLSNYDALIALAIERGYVSHEQRLTLQQWRLAPDKWGGAM